MFNLIVESILEEGSLLVMAQGVVDRLRHKRTDKATALEHLKDIIKSAKNQEDKQGIQKIINLLVNEEDTRKTYRVKWYHYPTNRSIDQKTTAASEDQAKTFIYSKYKDSILKYIKFDDFKPKITEVSPLQEKKQMHCWKGYKKKGTKKLPSGKVVNNCIKNV